MGTITAKATCDDCTKTATITVLSPRIIALTWADSTTGRKTSRARFGQEVFLHIDTEEAKNCSVFVVVQSDDWEEKHVAFQRVTQREFFPSERDQFGIYRPSVNAPEQTRVSITPQTRWLRNRNITSSEMTAKVYILSNLTFTTLPNEHEMRAMAETFERENIEYRDFSKRIMGKYVVHAEGETEKIEISRIVIVLDPGHGGRDPGVPAQRRERHEREIVLIVGIYAKDLLEKLMPDSKIVMTRSNNDTFVSLPDRVNITNDNDGDLFVSIHVDSGAREDTDEEGNAIVIINEQADTVRVFKRTNTNALTDRLADNLRTHLSKIVVSTQPVQIREGNFHVTREQRPHIGAVLIEIGFMTNIVQENLMNTDEYLHKIGTAISNAIVATMQEI